MPTNVGKRVALCSERSSFQGQGMSSRLKKKLRWHPARSSEFCLHHDDYCRVRDGCCIKECPALTSGELTALVTSSPTQTPIGSLSMSSTKPRRWLSSFTLLLTTTCDRRPSFADQPKTVSSGQQQQPSNSFQNAPPASQLASHMTSFSIQTLGVPDQDGTMGYNPPLRSTSGRNHYRPRHRPTLATCHTHTKKKSATTTTIRVPHWTKPKNWPHPPPPPTPEPKRRRSNLYPSSRCSTRRSRRSIMTIVTTTKVTHQQLQQVRAHRQARPVVVDHGVDPLADAPERYDEHGGHARPEHHQALRCRLSDSFHLIDSIRFDSIRFVSDRVRVRLIFDAFPMHFRSDSDPTQSKVRSVSGSYWGGGRGTKKDVTMWLVDAMTPWS